MTKTNEVAEKKMVRVLCGGIITKTGFNAYPPRSAPSYVSFEPNVATEMDAEVAAYLVAQDPTKFVVVEAKASENDAPKKSAKK